jgi:hypothetical protein
MLQMRVQLWTAGANAKKIVARIGSSCDNQHKCRVKTAWAAAAIAAMSETKHTIGTTLRRAMNFNLFGNRFRQMYPIACQMYPNNGTK